jgi:hypothetical protein
MLTGTAWGRDLGPLRWRLTMTLFEPHGSASFIMVQIVNRSYENDQVTPVLHYQQLLKTT